MSEWGLNSPMYNTQGSTQAGEKKQLPLRQNRDKPVLKYSGLNGVPGGIAPAQAIHANNNVPNATEKQPQVSGLYGVAAMASMYSAPFVNASNAATAYPNNNYMHMASSSPASTAYGVTPAQILSTAIQTSTKQTRNPYARPVSVTDIHPPGFYGQPPQSTLITSNSASSLSSAGSNNAPVVSSAAVSSSGTTSPSIQTNSFMRPTTATRRKQNEKAEANAKSKETTSHKSFTPSATLTTVEIMDGDVAMAIKPKNVTTISRPASASKANSVVRPAPAKKITLVQSNGSDTKPQGDSPVNIPRPPSADTAKRPPPVPRPAGKLYGEFSGRSASDTPVNTSPLSAAPTVPVSSSPNVSNYKPPPSPVINKSVKKTTAGRSENGSRAGSEVSSAGSAGSRSVSGSPVRAVTPSAEMAAKVRNLNYTPTKPYYEVDLGAASGGSTAPSPSNSDSSIKKVHTFVPRNTNIKNNVTKTSGDVAEKPPTPNNKNSYNMNPHLGAEDMTDPSLKKMPVTNTLTGTIYYRKASKSEEVIHDLKHRPLSAAEGALAKQKKEGKNAEKAEENGEEWEDDDDEGEDDDAGSEYTGPGSERVPGDGEDFDDFDDEDDGLDGIDDDFGESDDNSDGYSIRTNSSTASRGASAKNFRVRSATKRLANLSLRDRAASAKSTKSRPSTAKLRPGSTVSSTCSSSDGELQPPLMPSLFPHVPPTVNFVPDGQKIEQLPWEYRRLLKWRMSPITPNVVKNCISRSGFRATKKNHDWIGYWGKHMKAPGFKVIREYQKVNHFPGSFQIGRKDRLWRNLSKLQVHYGKKEFGFFPQTFVLPFDLKQLKRVWEDGGNKQKWIIKPPASARGIGIKVISKWNQIPKRKPVIVQKYLARPYLINGSKFDMRLYVYVTSYDPLRIYLYEDGLARFASTKYSYSMKSLSNKYMHLTNYSIQKRCNEYESNTDETVCQGHKWGLKALWGYMRKQGINTSAIWDNIKDLVVKTILSSESSVNSLVKMNVRRKNVCHELFGFDVMLDENFKPWIIEVNISPSLHSNSQLDMNIKGGMIKDLFNICGFVIPDKNDVNPLGPSVVDSSKWTPPNPVCIDRRLYPTQFSPDERAKHAYYCQRSTDEAAMATILDIYTPDDLRMLVETIDEDSRRGGFQRIFPSPHTHKYFRFFESQRYYNLLTDSWVQKYNRLEARGIAALESLCHKGIHLENPSEDPKHHWAPPSTMMRMNDPRAISAPLHPKGQGNSLPTLRRRKLQKAQGSTGSIANFGSRDVMVTPRAQRSAPVDPS